MRYAQDALETDKPWERWEFKRNLKGEWLSLSGNPAWDNKWEYRRKPKTININGFEVPEPMRESPEIGTTYYYVDFSLKNHVDDFMWDGGDFDMALLKSGALHLTQEAAEIHAKALLSFTEQK